jgi:hypothetical protein
VLGTLAALGITAKPQAGWGSRRPGRQIPTFATFLGRAQARFKTRRMGHPNQKQTNGQTKAKKPNEKQIPRRYAPRDDTFQPGSAGLDRGGLLGMTPFCRTAGVAEKPQRILRVYGVNPWPCGPKTGRGKGTAIALRMTTLGLGAQDIVDARKLLIAMTFARRNAFAARQSKSSPKIRGQNLGAPAGVQVGMI